MLKNHPKHRKAQDIHTCDQRVFLRLGCLVKVAMERMGFSCLLWSGSCCCCHLMPKTTTTLPSLKGAKWPHKQKLFQFFEILPLHTTTTGQLAWWTALYLYLVVMTPSRCNLYIQHSLYIIGWVILDRWTSEKLVKMFHCFPCEISFLNLLA